jgi:hypothetical protein
METGQTYSDKSIDALKRCGYERDASRGMFKNPAIRFDFADHYIAWDDSTTFKLRSYLPSDTLRRVFVIEKLGEQIVGENGLSVMRRDPTVILADESEEKVVAVACAVSRKLKPRHVWLPGAGGASARTVAQKASQAGNTMAGLASLSAALGGGFHAGKLIRRSIEEQQEVEKMAIKAGMMVTMGGMGHLKQADENGTVLGKVVKSRSDGSFTVEIDGKPEFSDKSSWPDQRSPRHRLHPSKPISPEQRNQSRVLRRQLQAAMGGTRAEAEGKALPRPILPSRLQRLLSWIRMRLSRLSKRRRV